MEQMNTKQTCKHNTKRQDEHKQMQRREETEHNKYEPTHKKKDRDRMHTTDTAHNIKRTTGIVNMQTGTTHR